MNSVFVVVVPEKLQLSIQVLVVPEEPPIQILPTYRSDDPFYEWM
jgi:hypothetical protein